MLDRLRIPLFVIAAIVLLLVIGAEWGSSLLPGGFNEAVMRTQTADALNGVDFDGDRDEVMGQAVRQATAAAAAAPPGVGIVDMALLDFLMLYAVLLMGLALVVPERIYGRIQGLATLIVSLLVLLAAIVMAIKTFVELMIMVSLFCAPPFGTIAYLVVWGFFNKGGAAAVLGATFFLKLVFAVLLALAHPRFLQNKGLVLIVLTSLLCSFVIGFLHSLVPMFLVSITDAIGGLIALILVIIWAIFLLIGSVISVVKAII